MNATSLLIRCREGDQAALAEYVRRCQPVIERLAISLLDDGRSDLIESIRSVEQETLLAAFSTPETFRDEAEFSTWLTALGLTACRRRLRTGRQPHKPVPVTGPAAQRLALMPAVQSLSLDLRLPLLLHYANGLSQAQVGQVLKLNLNTLLARLAAGRAALHGSEDREGPEHQVARRWIYRRLDQGLSGEERLHLDQHLEHCQSCRVFEGQVRQLERRLRVELPAAVSALQGEDAPARPLDEWLGQQLQLRQMTQARQRQAGVAALAIAGLIGVVIVVVQLQNNPPAAMPSLAEQSGTQTAIAAYPTATLAATQAPRASLPPPPDGRLLYEASDNRSTDLYFTHADASGRRLLDPNPSSDRAPHPSPDRGWVAFLSNRDNPRRYEIYLTDVEGNETQQLTTSEPTMPAWTGEMAWSPDSLHLAAVVDNPDPRVPFNVERGDFSDQSRGYEGQWEGRLYRIDVQTRQMTALTPPDLLVWNPAWSPDGTRVYFNALINGYTRLVSVKADGSDQRIEANIEGTGEQAGFSFSPDGKSLAYLVLRRTRGTNHPDGLYLYDLVSGRNRVLQTIPNTDDIDLALAARFATVRWSPDGQHLVYAIPDPKGQAVLRMIDVSPDPNLPGVLRASAETILYVGIDLYFPGHAPAWSLDSRSLGILQGRRVYVISAHSDADNAGGAELMEIYAGPRDEIGAAWLSWFQ